MIAGQTLTYLISLLIQLGVIIAVIAVILLFSRPGRHPRQDELELAIARMSQNLSILQDSVRQAIEEQIARLQTAEAQSREQQSKMLQQALIRVSAPLQEITAQTAAVNDTITSFRNEMTAALGALEKQIGDWRIQTDSHIATGLQNIQRAVDQVRQSDQIGHAHTTAQVAQIQTDLNALANRHADSIRELGVLSERLLSGLAALQARIDSLPTNEVLQELTRTRAELSAVQAGVTGLMTQIESHRSLVPEVFAPHHSEQAIPLRQ